MVTLNSLDPQAAWRKLYPFKSNFHQIGDHRLHYVDEGDSTGRPVVMVHGNPTWSFYYRNLISALGEPMSGFRPIAIDHIGCGLSDKPQDFDYCLESHVENVCSLVESLDLNNVTLVAHDWGGAIGLGALLKMRSRFERIVLFNTAAFPPPYIPFRIRVCRWPIVGQLGLQGFNLFAKMAISMATERRDGLPKDVADGLLAPYNSWANRVATHRFVKDIPLSKSHKTWQPLEEIERQLPELKDLPIKLIWGMKDWCFRPECLERLAAVWPNADVHRFESGGHYIVEDEPEEIVNLVADFLMRTS